MNRQQQTTDVNQLNEQVLALMEKVKDLELKANQERMSSMIFDGDRRYFEEWKIRMKAALEDMTEETERQKMKFIMDHAQDRAFRCLRRRLPWSEGAAYDAFKTGDEMLAHLDNRFGDFDHEAYAQTRYDDARLKQKERESFDDFLTKWEHYALMLDLDEADMVANLNQKLNQTFRKAGPRMYLPDTLRELAIGCREKERQLASRR
ncbi:hypothetical protein PMZ80_004631 [Knufia obscura]|uniref:Retrotransposon gag domain-containing protein n=2 Tax=Knufia TaxID=430999 RepID=A0AAN8ED73_9EURO|nr:hypothetical protein PMZ80_004631 [Knufia obscura]KAK5952623.1 hypothetical protein OHC33_006215 [Knufia fluminis]